jgi:hypothetical protein
MSKKEFLKAISFSGSSVGSLISGTLFLFGTWTWETSPYISIWTKNLLVDSMGVLFIISGLGLMAVTLLESFGEEE